jgi:hypothetical protein
VEQLRQARLERLLVLLEAARAELDRGWVQGGWWSVRAGGGRPLPVTGLAAAVIKPDQVTGVCLVGALLRAGSRQEGAEVGRAVDAVYDALWESRGHAITPEGVSDTVSSPQVRLRRVQTLTQWNDQAGRRREEVIGLLDRAIAGAMMRLVHSPAPRTSAPEEPALRA